MTSITDCVDGESVYIKYFHELDIHEVFNSLIEISKLIENETQFQTDYFTQEITTISGRQQISNDDDKKV